MKKSPFILILTLLLAGCKKSGDNKVHVHCDDLVNEKPANDPGQVFVANAFTPNGDGINDLFIPITFQISSIKVKVYNETSTLVFETSQLNTGWNPGLNVSNQVFYYRVEAVTNSNAKIGLCGEVYPLSCIPKNKTKSNFNFQDQLTPFGFTGVTNETLTNCN
jgi:gliding motility-associated-like protein